MGKGKQAGFTLVELLVSIAILLVAVTAIVPLFTFAIETAQINNMKEIAASLANRELEKIRGLEFAEIGVEGGNPAGDLKSTYTEPMNGNYYNIELLISWIQKGNHCDESLIDAPLWDYKSVKVKVEATGPRDRVVREEMETLIARSAFQESSPTSGIKICASRAWEDSKIPVPDVKVVIEGPNASKVQQWTTTTSQGAALFFLEEKETGDYLVTAKAPLGMMVKPEDEKFSLFVPEKNWANKRIYLEYSCFIELALKDEKTKNIINNKSGDLILTSIFFPPEGKSHSFSRQPIGRDIVGPLWPLGDGYTGAYGLDVINVPDYYDLDWEKDKIFKSDESQWDGTFTKPGEDLSLTAYLMPIPATPDNLIDAINLDWLNGNSHVINDKPDKPIAKNEDDQLEKVHWLSGNEQDPIKLNNDNIILTAWEMYWERKLQIDEACLTVAAELFKFANPVILGSKVNKQGMLILRLPEGYSFGIDGDRIDGGDGSKKYGEVHFVEDVFSDEALTEILIKKGAYYFPDGINLPAEANDLIPFHILD